jgi:hypothetical protein
MNQQPNKRQKRDGGEGKNHFSEVFFPIFCQGPSFPGHFHSLKKVEPSRGKEPSNFE